MIRFNAFVSLALAILASAFAPATRSAVGRTPGALEVTGSGTARYSIPIFVPPGPRGIQPNIALVYDSAIGSGPLGKGWSIAGISSIARCNQTFAQDGVSSAVSLDTSDGYCLNGNRLKLRAGSYGSSGSQYFTEITDFSLVTANGTAGNGPASFTVQDRSGLVYEYGGTASSLVSATGSSTASSWMLSEIRDRAGNKVVFSYAAPGNGLSGTTVIKKIEWTQTSPGSSYFINAVEFTYGANSVLGSDLTPANSPERS